MRIESERLTFRFATINDKRKIYEMLVSKDILHFMFNDKFPPPTWEDIDNEGDFYYTGEANKRGSYLLIELDREVIGTISYSCEYTKKVYCELDIWFKSTNYTGSGFGPESINRIISFVNNQYNITTFIMRPWCKNLNAIKAYKKCGFVENRLFNVEKYYSEEILKEYGEGDYKEETVNLVKII